MFADAIYSAESNYPLVRAMHDFYFTRRADPIAEALAPYLRDPVNDVSLGDYSYPFPRMARVETAAEVVYLFLGIEDFASARDWVLGYASAVIGGDFTPHPALAPVISRVRTPPSRDNYVLDKDYTFVGYSFGGCVAWATNEAAKTVNRTLRSKVVTFGMPRCTEGPSFIRPRRPDLYRYMNEEDPVVYLPLHSDEEQLLGVGLPPPIDFGNSWWHPDSTGEVLYANGSRLTVPYPPLASTGLRASQAGWALGLLTEPVLGHSIGRYEARLRAAVPLTIGRLPNDAPAVMPPAVAPSPVPLAPTKSRPSPGQAPLPPAVAGEIASRRANPGLPPYYAAKVSGRWWVFHWADPLFVVPGGRAARKAAARLNGINAAWLRSPVGDQQALLASVAEEFPNE